MIEDPNLDELWRVKEDIARRFNSVKEYALAVQKLAAERPLPPAGNTRKAIAGIPAGISVADDDDTLREIRAVREKLLAEAGGDLHEYAERAAREAAKEKPSSNRRTVAGKVTPRRTFRSSKNANRKRNS